MDVLSQSELEFSEHDTYAEQHKLFWLFQNMLEKIIINRPDDPINYLQQLLTKGYKDVQQVLVLGAPSADRKLLVSSLQVKFKLVHLTPEGLAKHADSDIAEGLLREYDNLKQLPDSFWATMIKRRIEKADCSHNGFILEGFPKTRAQAFLMRKQGIFPTHIVCLEDPMKGNEDFILEEDLQEFKDLKANYSMLVDFYRNNNIKHFKIDRFWTSIVLGVENFLRNKEPTFIAYAPRVLVFGPPGSGKKTLISMLTSKYPLKAVRFQDTLRQAILNDGPYKDKLEKTLSTTEPVTDELLTSVVTEKLRNKECKENGWIMEGFPFTLDQAKLLTEYMGGYQPNKAIFLESSLETSISRLNRRRYDPETGSSCHLDSNPPPAEIMGRLVQNYGDAREETAEMYKIYESYYAAMQGYYSRELLEDIVFTLDTESDPVETVFEILENIVLGSSRRKPPSSNWFDFSSRNTGIY